MVETNYIGESFLFVIFSDNLSQYLFNSTKNTINISILLNNKFIYIIIEIINLQLF